EGLMAWHVDSCAISAADATIYWHGCTGEQRFYMGNTTVSATRTITGKRETLLSMIESIAPDSRESATITLDQVDFNDFLVYSYLSGSTQPLGIAFRTGTMTG